MMSWRTAPSPNCTRVRKPMVSAYYYSNSSIPVGYFGTTIRRRPVGFGFEAPFQNRRNFTNSRERWRQHHVNMAFGELRKLLPTYPPDKKLSKHEILKLSMKYISFLSGVLKGMDSNQAEICPDCVMEPSKCSPSSGSATSSNDGVLSARLDLEHVSVDSLTSQIRLEEEGDWIPGNLCWNHDAIRYKLDQKKLQWSEVLEAGKADFHETWEFARIEEQTMSHWHWPTETRAYIAKKTRTCSRHYTSSLHQSETHHCNKNKLTRKRN